MLCMRLHTCEHSSAQNCYLRVETIALSTTHNISCNSPTRENYLYTCWLHGQTYSDLPGQSVATSIYGLSTSPPCSLVWQRLRPNGCIWNKAAVRRTIDQKTRFFELSFSLQFSDNEDFLSLVFKCSVLLFQLCDSLFSREGRTERKIPSVTFSCSKSNKTGKRFC